MSNRKITQEELESYLWGSAVLLRNHIDAGAYKQYIFPLLFFKRLNDVFEEETEKAVSENGPEAAANYYFNEIKEGIESGSASTDTPTL